MYTGAYFFRGHSVFYLFNLLIKRNEQMVKLNKVINGN